MKKNRGITLIALVITIIVLLILAGVAISMLSGENGILKKAADAKTNTEEAKKEEAATLIDYDIESHFILNNSKYKCRNGFITGVTMDEDGVIVKDTVDELNNALKDTGYTVATYISGENDEEGYQKEEDITDTSIALATGMGIKKDGKGEVVARVIVFGDLNGDGMVKNHDGSLIMQFLGGIVKKKDYMLPAMDINHDGKITMDDAGLPSTGVDDQNQYATGPNKLNIRYLSDVEKDYIENDLPEAFKTQTKYKFEYDSSKGEYVLKGATVGEATSNITSLFENAIIRKGRTTLTQIESGCSILIDTEKEGWTDGFSFDIDV